MDMVKIGKFLAELRRKQNLTQEQLGEELGVTNKTVSRWENGNYLPPVEMLQLLSEKYGITINEILAGEPLDETAFREKADENIKSALKKSVFSLKEQREYFGKKWLKDHCFELVLEIAALTVMAILGAIFYHPVTIAASILCLVWTGVTNNRKMAYIESHLCSNDEESENENKSNSPKN